MKKVTTTTEKPAKEAKKKEARAKEAKKKTMPTFGMFKYMQTKNNK